jgi:hypothetical protein
MMSGNRYYRRVTNKQLLIIKGIVFFFPVVLFVGSSLIYLFRTGELYSVRQVVRRQVGTGCIYGTAIHPNDKEYKLEGYRQSKPAIAMLGSSRVEQFRAALFDDAFYNLGGAMTSIDEGRFVIPKLLAIHKPETLYLGVDFWWFNSAYQKPTDEEQTPPDISQVALIRQPTMWMLQGKITFGEFVQTILHGSGCNIGVKAVQNGDGFSADGSYNYGSVLAGKSYDAGFHDTKGRIARGDARFQYGQTVDPVLFQRFLDLLQLLRDHHVKTVIFLPPLAPTVLQEMDQRFAYIKDLKDQLKAHRIPFFDFLTPFSDDCEFYDGFHGGDVTAARMLDAMQPSDRLTAFIVKNHGKAAATDTKDFLKLGCRKEDVPPVR